MKRNNANFKLNRKRLLLWLGTLLIVAGISLAAFPFLHNIYYRYVQANEAAQLMEKLEEVQEKEGDIDKEKTENSAILPEKEPPTYPKYLEPGEGILEIPALELFIKIGYGVDLEDLKPGPGFYPHSGFPDTGNVSIAGHRAAYGSPFYNLHLLQEEDRINLYYQDRVYTYQVEKVFDTHTRDWSVIDPTPTPALTLTTCHPIGSDSRRLVVRAYLQ